MNRLWCLVAASSLALVQCGEANHETAGGSSGGDGPADGRTECDAGDAGARPLEPYARLRTGCSLNVIVDRDAGPGSLQYRIK